jgi:signal transduction histidine kinase
MTRGLDAPVQREERRFRRARLVLACVVTVTLLQIGWWIFFQIRTTNREYDNERLLGRDPVEAEAQRSRRVRMTASEGGFLLLVVIGGVASIWWLMRRELRREYEQNQLLAAMSHDFRSPLTAIRLLAQSFEMNRVPEAERARASKTLLANVQRLEDLVENVLVAARLHAGRLAPRREPLDLAAEVEKCLEQRAALLSQRGAEIDGALPRGVRVLVDRSLLQSILGNLVDNALKFADGTPHIALSLARDGARAVLRVRDRGVGFAPEEAGRLFERFHRGGAEQDVSRPGLGLGLFLVREFARLSGGDVVATSDGPGRGSEFVVMLPLAGDAPATAPAPAGAPA